MTYNITIKAKELLAIAGFASKDNSRPNLLGVHVDFDEAAGKNRIVATSGHVLGMMDDAVLSYENDTGNTIIKITKALLTMLKQKDVDAVVFCDEGFCKGFSEDGTLVGTCMAGMLEYSFPQYERMIPAPYCAARTDEVHDLFFDMSKLAPFIAASKALSPRAPQCVQFNRDYSDASAPVLLSLRNVASFTGILMPFKAWQL